MVERSCTLETIDPEKEVVTTSSSDLTSKDSLKISKSSSLSSQPTPRDTLSDTLRLLKLNYVMFFLTSKAKYYLENS